MRADVEKIRLAKLKLEKFGTKDYIEHAVEQLSERLAPHIQTMLEGNHV